MAEKNNLGTLENSRGESGTRTDNVKGDQNDHNASTRASWMKDLADGSPGGARQVLTQLEQAQGRSEGELQRVVNGQGYVLGQPYDWLKNHLGSSSEGRAWYNTAALWSHILDYDSGSDAATKRVNDTHTALDTAESLLQKGDTTAADNVMSGLITKDQNGNPVLKSELEAGKYDNSQQAGVNFLSDLAVMTATYPVSSLAARILVGGTTKTALKWADGPYSQPVSDFATGAIVSLAPGAGKYAGAWVSKGVDYGAQRLAGVLSGMAPVLGYGTDTAVLSGLLSGTEAYTQQRYNGSSFMQSLVGAGQQAGESALIGFGLGIAGGTAGEFWRRSSVLTTTESEGRFAQPVLGQHPQEVRQLITGAWDKAKASGNQFEATLKTELNGILDKYGLPPIRQFEWRSSGKFLGDTYGQTKQDRLQFFDTPSYDAVNFISHELTHWEQYVMRTRMYADMANIPRDFNQSHLYDVGKSITSSRDADEVILNYRKQLPDINLTQAETLRAQSARKGFDDYWGIKNYRDYRRNPIEREAYRVGWLVDFYNRAGVGPTSWGVTWGESDK